MSTADITYFMGQGKVYVAPRIANGAINGPFKYVGDCSVLQLTANQKFDDVEESTSGSRLVAAHIPNGLSYAAKLTAEQWSADNLAKATYGSNSGLVAAGSVTAEKVTAYNGAGTSSLVPLANPGVSSVVATLDGAATTLASIGVNNAGTSALAADTRVPVVFTGATATTQPTAVAVIGSGGAIDHYEVTGHGSGITVFPTGLTVTGVTGMTAYFNPGATALVIGTDITVDAANGAISPIAGSHLLSTGAQPDAVGVPISVAYSYASYTAAIESILTGNGIQEYAVRFQGLNTANGNSPVIITCWRFAMNLAKTLDFIAAKHGMLELDGMLLPDTTRDGSTKSQFFSIVKV